MLTVVNVLDQTVSLQVSMFVNASGIKSESARFHSCQGEVQVGGRRVMLHRMAGHPTSHQVPHVTKKRLRSRGRWVTRH